MSKYVKNLITDHLRQRLQNVHDALLVNMVGLDVNANTRLRAELRSKNIQVLVVKNSLAARATEGTPLAPLFAGLGGTAALCWGGEDVVTLAKEIAKLVKNDKYPPFAARGAVIDGECLDAPQLEQVSKWPSRTEQLSILLGQILSPGAILLSQLNSVGGALASQIEQRGERGEEGTAESFWDLTAEQKPLAVCMMCRKPIGAVHLNVKICLKCGYVACHECLGDDIAEACGKCGAKNAEIFHGDKISEMIDYLEQDRAKKLASADWQY
jgi:large subunit ribosomal protein L10